MDVPVSRCPECGQPGRVVLVKGKFSRRRICDQCRHVTWDVGEDRKQMGLKLEESVDIYTSKGSHDS